MKIKRCIKCNRFELEDCDYCIRCGDKLHIITKGKQNQLIAICAIVVLAFCMLMIFIVEEKRINDTHDSIERYQYEKAKEEYESTPTVSDLKVNP